ncbi:MAG: methyltransferase domain-containing protein [Chromatocurvus sp.]
MSNEEQIAYWNGDAGRKWAQKDDMMSAMLQPIAADLLQQVDFGTCRRVIDVGCGGGSETLMLAGALQNGAEILGIDISAPLLTVARARLAASQVPGRHVDFIEADAATHTFAENEFDGLFSRFGLMFYDDAVTAFANLHRALQAGALLAFSCWQGLEHNPWVAVPLAAALQHLPPPERPDPGAPGPFAFADADRVRGILQRAGFTDVTIAPHAVQMCWTPGQDLPTSVRELVNIGPVGRLLADADDATRDRVHAAAIDALTPYYREARLCLPGAVWFVTGRAGKG